MQKNKYISLVEYLKREERKDRIIETVLYVVYTVGFTILFWGVAVLYMAAFAD